MSTAAPDDPFDDIVAGLELDETPDNVTDFSALDTVALMDIYQELTQELFAREETMNPRTPQGRELHSRRPPAVVELHNRDIL